MPTKYSYKKYQGGGAGGGLRGMLANILGGGNTASANEEASPELLDFLGEDKGYVDSKGKFVSTPYSDTRGFMARLAGAPNTAEELNLGLDVAQKEGALKNKLGADWLTTAGPIEARNAARLTFSRDTGLPPEMYDQFVDLLAAKARASLGASTSEANLKNEQNKTGLNVEKATGKQKVRVATNEANRGVTESTERNLAASSKEGKQATRSRYMAEQLTPAFNLERLATRSVGPGEVQQFRSQGMGSDLERILGPGFDAFGQTTQRTPQMLNIGGKQYPTGDVLQITTPGSITPAFQMSPQDFSKSYVPGQTGGGPNIAAIKEVAPSPIAPNLQLQGPAPSSGQNSIYDFPPEISAMLGSPQYPDKAGIINRYYNQLIQGAAPSFMDEVSNFFGTSLDYNTKKRKQEELRRLLTPNY